MIGLLPALHGVGMRALTQQIYSYKDYGLAAEHWERPEGQPFFFYLLIDALAGKALAEAIFFE